MQDMAAARSSSNEIQKEILQLITKNDHDVDERANLNKSATMNGIEQTQRVIMNFEVDLEKHKAKKKNFEKFQGFS